MVEICKKDVPLKSKVGMAVADAVRQQSTSPATWSVVFLLFLVQLLFYHRDMIRQPKAFDHTRL